MTRQREIIYNILKECGHLTAEEVYLKAKAQLPSIAMGTVYRNLGLMVDVGEIGRIYVYGKPDIYDRCATPHEHCVCSHCGKVCDINVTDIKPTLEKLLGIQIESYNLDIKYLCDECKKSATDAE